MHEYSLVAELVRQVEEAAASRPGAVVRRVEVAVGELAGVDPALFQQAFEVLRPGTPCAGAELVVASLPARWSCPACRRAFAVGERLRCAACDRPARLEPGGEALTLTKIELEVA